MEDRRHSEKQTKQSVQGSEISLRYENKKQIAKSVTLGAFIGLAVILPGVSGSTAAIILRLYEKLLYAIGNLFTKFRKCVRFLLPIAAGAVFGLIFGFLGVKALLTWQPFAIVALFAGLMLGAFPSVKDQWNGERLTALHAVFFAAGFAFPIAVSLLSIFASPGAASLEKLQAWHAAVFLLLGYAVAVTQLVPGLSATALLMTVGYFTPLMDSISFSYWQRNPHIILVYLFLFVGFAAGLLTVSKLLSRLLKRRRGITFYTVAGLSLGSIVTMFLNPEMTAVYQSWGSGAGKRQDLGVGIALFLIGMIAAYLLVRYERKHADIKND